MYLKRCNLAVCRVNPDATTLNTDRNNTPDNSRDGECRQYKYEVLLYILPKPNPSTKDVFYKLSSNTFIIHKELKNQKRTTTHGLRNLPTFCVTIIKLNAARSKLNHIQT